MPLTPGGKAVIRKEARQLIEFAKTSLGIDLTARREEETMTKLAKKKKQSTPTPKKARTPMANGTRSTTTATKPKKKSVKREHPPINWDSLQQIPTATRPVSARGRGKIAPPMLPIHEKLMETYGTDQMIPLPLEIDGQKLDPKEVVYQLRRTLRANGHDVAVMSKRGDGVVNLYVQDRRVRKGAPEPTKTPAA